MFRACHWPLGPFSLKGGHEIFNMCNVLSWHIKARQALTSLHAFNYGFFIAGSALPATVLSRVHRSVCALFGLMIQPFGVIEIFSTCCCTTFAVFCVLIVICTSVCEPIVGHRKYISDSIFV